MEDLAKLIFEKKGKLLVPNFEHGRIIVRENTHQAEGIVLSREAGLYILERSSDEEQQASHALRSQKKGESHRVLRDKFSEDMREVSLGDMFLAGGSRHANFRVDVNYNDRGKGYGTALMNGGAQYCRDVGVETITGKLLQDKNKTRRTQFYRDLGMNAWTYEEEVSGKVNNPKLNEIEFTQNAKAEEVWNELAKAKLGINI